MILLIIMMTHGRTSRSRLIINIVRNQAKFAYRYTDTQMLASLRGRHSVVLNPKVLVLRILRLSFADREVYFHSIT